MAAGRKRTTPASDRTRKRPKTAKKTAITITDIPTEILELICFYLYDPQFLNTDLLLASGGAIVPVHHPEAYKALLNLREANKTLATKSLKFFGNTFFRWLWFRVTNQHMITILQTFRFSITSVTFSGLNCDPDAAYQTDTIGVAKALSQLKKLHQISFYWTNIGSFGFSNDFCNIVAGNVESERLEWLEFDQARVNADILCQLIARHKNTLRKIFCLNVSLFNGNWDKVIRAMQEVKKLYCVDISDPREDDDRDFSRKVLLHDEEISSYNIVEWKSNPEESTKRQLDSMLCNYRRVRDW